MIRLIALDIDGTLVGHDLNISPRVAEAVARVRERGVIVTLATGRGAEPTRKFAAQLGLTAPLICLQGAQIYDPVLGRDLREARLAPAIVPWIAAHAAERGWHLHFESPDQVYMPAGQPTPDILRDLFRITALTRVSDFAAEMPEVPAKFLITVHDAAERDAVAAELQRLRTAAGLPLQLLNSHPNLVEGLPPGVDKAHGLAWLAGHVGVAQAEVLAIGDNDNDVTMLQWAGVGVAMGGGTDGARAAADWLAPGVEADGVAAALERFVLSS